MKEFFYRLFALFFRLSRMLPVKDKRVALVSMHNEGFNDSLGALKMYLEKQGGYELVFINKNDLSVGSPIAALRFFLVSSRLLATSHYAFLNDNFLPMGMLNFSEKTVITQLWHAEGVFKKFGLSIEQPESVRRREIAANKKLSYVVCTSKGVAPFYAEAFGIPENRVLPLGSPRTDFLFNSDKSLRAEFEKKYPQAKNKKLVLYAPTFRDDEQRDKRLLDNFDIERFQNELSDEYVLAVRLHPQLHADTRNIGAIDLTSYANPAELVNVFDVLITDYSSICMDFVLLNKPVVFYAFDLSYYNEARSFYFDYEKYVPGAVAKDMDALVATFKKPLSTDKQESFRRFNFDFFDGKAAQRVAENIIL